MDQATKDRYEGMGVVYTPELREWHGRTVELIARMRKKKPSEVDNLPETAFVISAHFARISQQVARMIKLQVADLPVPEGPTYVPRTDDQPREVEVVQNGKVVIMEFVGDDSKQPDKQIWVRKDPSLPAIPMARKMLLEEVSARQIAESENMAQPVRMIEPAKV